jgi:hypothetical protein
MLSSPGLVRLRWYLVSVVQPVVNKISGVVFAIIVGVAARRDSIVGGCGGLDRMRRLVG